MPDSGGPRRNRYGKGRKNRGIRTTRGDQERGENSKTKSKESKGLSGSFPDKSTKGRETRTDTKPKTKSPKGEEIRENARKREREKKSGDKKSPRKKPKTGGKSRQNPMKT